MGRRGRSGRGWRGGARGRRGGGQGADPAQRGGPRARPPVRERARARGGDRLRRALDARGPAAARQLRGGGQAGHGRGGRLRPAAAVLRRPGGRGDLDQRAEPGLRRASGDRGADEHDPHRRRGARPRREDAQVLRPTGGPVVPLRRRGAARRQPPPRDDPRHQPRALARQRAQVRRQGRPPRRPRPSRHADAARVDLPAGRRRVGAQRPRGRRHAGGQDDPAQLPRRGDPRP